MNTASAEALLETSLKTFSGFIGEPVMIETMLLSRQDIKDRRTQIFHELEAVYEPFAESTLGETITGSKGSVILLYPFNMVSEQEFIHVLFHECGHWHFREVNPELIRKQQTSGALSRTVQLGFTLFDEFIAETLANFATPEAPLDNEESKRKELVHVLYQALPGINPERTEQAYQEKAAMRSGYYVLPTGLGMYCAMILTDPTLISLASKNPKFDRGFGPINGSVMSDVQDIIMTLVEYINEYGDSVEVDEELLIKIGSLVENIWDVRSKQRV